MAKPYVYALLDPRTDEIFYIGKGKGRRWREHLKGRSHNELVNQRVSEIKAAGIVPESRVLQFDTDEQAWEAERKLIAHVNDTTRSLLNKAGGGAGSTRGMSEATQEWREAQGERSRKNWENPEYRAKVERSIRERLACPEYKQARREQMRQRFADPEYREAAVARLVKANKSEAMKKKRSAQMKAQWADPEIRARYIENNRRINSDPEKVAQAAAKRKAQWADPDHRARRIEAMLQAHATKWFFVGDLRFARAKEAAEHFQVSETTIRNWIKKGKVRVEERNASI